MKHETLEKLRELATFAHEMPQSRGPPRTFGILSPTTVLHMLDMIEAKETERLAARNLYERDLAWANGAAELDAEWIAIGKAYVAARAKVDELEK